MVNVKVNAGLYKTQPSKCFCGSEDFYRVRDNHYGATCLCNNCGILYANPVLTEESSSRFFSVDYKNDLHKSREEIMSFVEQYLSDMDEKLPDTTIEISTNKINSNKHSKLSDSKYDLVILRDIEYMVDIETTMRTIRDLMNDNGYLYVETPGLYAYDRSFIMQNSCNWVFNGNTLYYVMRCCGFDDLMITEEIQSLWKKSEHEDKKQIKQGEAEFIKRFLSSDPDKFLMPEMRCNCMFPLKKRIANSQYIIDSGIPEMSPLVNTHPESKAVIIGGGPSVNGFKDKIRKMKSEGYTIYSIERMYGWCLDNDIVPDYVICLDASDDVSESFTRIHDDVVHIIMSQVGNETVNILKGKKAYYFLTAHKNLDLGKTFKNLPRNMVLINTGGSVTLCAFSIAMTVGARDFHIFGFDCHLGNGNYAKGITGVGGLGGTTEIEINGRVFKTTGSYFSFMQQFFELYSIGKALGLFKEVKIYGDSMITYAAKIDLRGK
jgi:hypothetical protein